MKWLHQNPLVEFKGIDIVSDRWRISLNDKMVVVIPARKVDLTGNIALQMGRGNIISSPGQAQEFFIGAEHSRGGRALVALPSRNLNGQSNILVSVKDFPNQLTNRESLDMVITEYGVAYLTGRTIRERSQALIDIAHPDDREALVRQAKENKLLYPDQIYLAESGHLYPNKIACTHTLKNGTTIHFRAIKPSDEDEMRKLFYRFSDQAVYYRYFSPIKTMPHVRMQEYVNVDYTNIMSIVGVVSESGLERIIAEGRYARRKDTEHPFADTAFIVDERFQGRGIASFLLTMFIQVAKEHGIGGFYADILAVNKAMIRVFEKTGLSMQASMKSEVYHLTIPFEDRNEYPL